MCVCVCACAIVSVCECFAVTNDSFEYLQLRPKGLFIHGLNIPMDKSLRSSDQFPDPKLSRGIISDKVGWNVPKDNHNIMSLCQKNEEREREAA